MLKLKLYIDGQYVDAERGGSRQSINPFNGEPIATFAWADERDAEKAIAAARHAFDHGPWREMTGSERKDLLNRMAQLLQERIEHFARNEVLDAGALIGKARTDVGLCARTLRYYAKMAERYNREPQPVEDSIRPGRSLVYTVREPLGVCGQIIPWNFPITMAIWKLGAALATGNTVVLKCAPETPVSALELGQLCEDAGVPPGVVNIITGDVEAGETLVRSPQVDKIAFTGSTDVGRRIAAVAADTMKHITLECGGKSANIVLKDADPEVAVDGSLYAAFFHCGQICVSGTRLLLDEIRYDEFLDRLVDRTRGMKIGDPMDPETQIGPLISERQMKRVLKYIDLGKREGAKLSIGGKRAKGGVLDNGFFVEPTIFSEVSNDMTIAREEIFGPVLCVLRYGNVDEAVRIANDSIYGLAAGVWSRDLPEAWRVAAQINAGWVWINEWHIMTERAPFGGYKHSGIGREFSEEGLNAYTEVKTVFQDDTKGRDAKVWYDMILPRA